MINSLQQPGFFGSYTWSLLLGLAASQVLVQPSFADESLELRDFRECRTIEAKAERLLCYDTIADGGIFRGQQFKQLQEENFGNNDEESASSVDQVNVTVVRVQKTSSGAHYFYTAKGSVWKQSNKGNWNLDVPFQAQIKSGSLHSYFLVAESGKSTRVKRVR